MYVGLGQTIPWQCWEASGFKACHAVQWRSASDMCQFTRAGDGGYEGDVGRCVEEQTYRFTRDACFPLCKLPQQQDLPLPMTEEEIEEAGGKPEGSTNWKLIVGVGALGALGLVLLGGVLMGRDYERKRAAA